MRVSKGADAVEVDRYSSTMDIEDGVQTGRARVSSGEGCEGERVSGFIRVGVEGSGETAGTAKRRGEGEEGRGRRGAREKRGEGEEGREERGGGGEGGGGWGAGGGGGGGGGGRGGGGGGGRGRGGEEGGGREGKEGIGCGCERGGDERV